MDGNLKGDIDMERCPKCNKKVRYRQVCSNYYCGNCKVVFTKDEREVNWIGDLDPLRVCVDSNNNYYFKKEEKQGNIIIQKTMYFLEPEKTTLRGDYPKLNESKCKFPNRLDCNSGCGYERCEFMKYDNSKSIYDSNRWCCSCKK